MLCPNSPQETRQKRKGIVLIAVLVVVAFLALAAYRFNDNMEAEYQATNSAIRLVQARSVADSGLAFVLSEIAQGNVPQSGLTQQITLPNSMGTGTFEILTIEDESAKWNLNALLALDKSGKQIRDLLTKMQPSLPSLTPAIIDAIVDWMDADDTPGEIGAENSYYNGLPTPYSCKNGPLDSIDELLLVKDVTPEILFGTDLNPGLISYFTVFSREQNVVPSTGATAMQAFSPKVNLNDPDIVALQNELNGKFSENLANFILAYRLYGGSRQPTSTITVLASLATGRGSSGGVAGMNSNDYSAITAEIQKKLSDPNVALSLKKIPEIMDLVNSNVTVTIPSSQSSQSGQSGGQAGGQSGRGGQGGGQQSRSVTFPSPLKDVSTAKQYLPLLFQNFTTTTSVDLPAKINVLGASEVALQGLPSLDATEIQQLLSSRPSAEGQTDPLYLTPTWIFTDAGLPPAKVKSIEKYVTGQSTAYRVRVLGRLDSGGPMGLMEAVVEASGPRPRVVYFRDLSEKARQARDAGGSVSKLAGL